MDFSRRVSKVSVFDAKMSSAKSERSTIVGNEVMINVFILKFNSVL